MDVVYSAFNSFINDINFKAMFMLLLIVILVSIIYKLNKSEDSPFKFENLLLGDNGKASGSKLAQLIALVVSTWGFITLTLDNKLTEWYFVGYIGVWVLGRLGSSAISTKSTQTSDAQ